MKKITIIVEDENCYCVQYDDKEIRFYHLENALRFKKEKEMNS